MVANCVTRVGQYVTTQALTIVAVTIRVGGTHDMGICPGQAPMTMSSFCLFRVKTVQSEEDSASCEVLAGLIQPLIAVSSANYVFSSKPSLRQPSKKVMEKENSVFSLIQDMSKIGSSRANTAIEQVTYCSINTIWQQLAGDTSTGACLSQLTHFG